MYLIIKSFAKDIREKLLVFKVISLKVIKSHWFLFITFFKTNAKNNNNAIFTKKKLIFFSQYQKYYDIGRHCRYMNINDIEKDSIDPCQE